MSQHSTTPLVRATLAALLAPKLKALTPSTTWTWSNPGSKRVSDNAFLGSVRKGVDADPVMRAGRRKREENYIVEVCFEYFRGGDDGQDAEVAAFQAFGVLEDLLADHIDLGLAAQEPTLRAQLDTWSVKTDFDMAQNGWATKLVADVQIRCRLV